MSVNSFYTQVCIQGSVDIRPVAVAMQYNLHSKFSVWHYARSAVCVLHEL